MATATYSDLSGLAGYNAFLDNSAQAVVKYATYLVGQAGAATFNQSQWARGLLLQAGGPRAFAMQIAPIVARDTIFLTQPAGSTPAAMLAAVTDAQLQAAVEAAIAVYYFGIKG